MSSTYSAASADSVSDLSEPGCEQLRSVKSTPMQEPSSESTGPTFPATRTCENSPQTDWLPMESGSMSSAGDSLARTSATPGRGQDWPASGRGYGQRLPDWLASYNPTTSSWRTSQHCLVEGLSVYSETWPRSGMTRNGTAYQLPPLVPLTDGTESGSWPTPRKSSVAASARMEVVGNITNPRGNLEEEVHAMLWGTPTARDWKDSGSCLNVPENSLLGRMVKTSLGPMGKDGFVNPDFHLWLMGFPEQWNVLEPAEMPSSRKSPKSSGERSWKRIRNSHVTAAHEMKEDQTLMSVGIISPQQSETLAGSRWEAAIDEARAADSAEVKP